MEKEGSKSQVFQDSLAAASVYRERYARGIITRILNLLDDAELSTIAKLERRLAGLTATERAAFVRGNASTKRLQAILEQIREMSRNVRQIVSTEINISAKDLVEAELAFSKDLLSTLGVEATLGESISVAQVVASVKSTPFSGRHLRSYVRDFDTKTRSQMMEVLRVGFSTGETSGEIARELRNRFKTTKRNAEVLTITSMNHFSNRAYEMQYAALGVSKVRLRVTLDGRTGAFCRSIDESKEYPIDRPHPTPPFHARCRTIVQAVIPGFDDDLGNRPFVADTRKVSKIPKSERKGKIGQVKASTSYSDFLGRNLGLARSVLGPTKYNLWRSGKLKLEKFIDMRAERAYTIAELRERHSRIFKDLNL